MEDFLYSYNETKTEGITKQNNLLQLMEETGYQICQVNGQRIFGPYPNWVGPPPSKNCEVFIGKLPVDVFEDELVPLFQSIGTIYELRLMMDFSGKTRGFGFVKYINSVFSQLAIEKLNNYEIRPGKFIGVVKSVNNCQLYIGGIPKDKSKEEILQELKTVVEGIVNIVMYYEYDCNMGKQNRGFIFVEFETHRQAALARRKFLSYESQLWGRDIVADWSLPERQVDENIMKQVKILFIRNLAPETSELTILMAMGSVVGKDAIIKVKKLKDFAFVHFTSREKAEKALRFWNGKVIDDSTIEVTWAKPDLKHKAGIKNGITPGTEQTNVSSDNICNRIQSLQIGSKKLPRPILGSTQNPWNPNGNKTSFFNMDHVARKMFGH